MGPAEPRSSALGICAISRPLALTGRHAVLSRGSRALIRAVENATGRMGLIRRADIYGDEIAGGRDV